jgi:hypothetical protein
MRIRNVKCERCKADLSARKTETKSFGPRLRAPERVSMTFASSRLDETGRTRRRVLMLWFCPGCVNAEVITVALDRVLEAL